MLEDGALKDAEGASVAGVGGGRVGAQVEAAAALGAQAVEGALPGDVGEEVGGLGARGEDQVFVVGAFGYEGADFVLVRWGVWVSDGVVGGKQEGGRTLEKISFSSKLRSSGAARSR